MNDYYVVIPAYNEEKNIGKVIPQVKNYTHNIVVVDDGSSDRTFPQAQENDVTVLRHKTNLGKGAALKTGCEYAIQAGADKIVVLDADGQHDPAEIPFFIDALTKNDIVFGSRAVPDSMPLIMLFGNKVLSTTLKWFYGIKVEDTQCGFRAFTSSAYKIIQWEALDYYIETEMVVKAGKQKLKYSQIPIKTIYNDNYKGTTVLDGITIMAKMLSWRLFK